MRIAIASEGKSLSSEISERGGRAPHYLIFEEGKIQETIKNPFAKGAGGSGWSVAHMLADKKINLVIAGKIGENMKTALNEKAIKFQEKLGKVSDIVK